MSHIIKDLHKAPVTTTQPHQRHGSKRTGAGAEISAAVKEELHYTRDPGFTGWAGHPYVQMNFSCVLKFRVMRSSFFSGEVYFIPLCLPTPELMGTNPFPLL